MSAEHSTARLGRRRCSRSAPAVQPQAVWRAKRESGNGVHGNTQRAQHGMLTVRQQLDSCPATAQHAGSR